MSPVPYSINRCPPTPFDINHYITLCPVTAEVAGSSPVVPAILEDWFASPSHRYALLRTSRRPCDSIMIAKPETFRSCYSTVLGLEGQFTTNFEAAIMAKIVTSV